MRIFALETNTDLFKKQFLFEDEQEVHTIYYHWFKFALRLVRQLLFTIPLILLAAGIVTLGAPLGMVILIAVIFWLIFIVPSAIQAFLDWRYDFIFITTDKVVIADQSSLFRQRITPSNLENFASVSSETQFMNLFPFGKLHFHLKAGMGKDLVLSYIPDADGAVSKIANAVTVFQRRKDLRRYGDQDAPLPETAFNPETPRTPPPPVSPLE